MDMAMDVELDISNSRLLLGVCHAIGCCALIICTRWNHGGIQPESEFMNCLQLSRMIWSGFILLKGRKMVGRESTEQIPDQVHPGDVGSNAAADIGQHHHQQGAKKPVPVEALDGENVFLYIQIGRASWRERV